MEPIMKGNDCTQCTEIHTLQGDMHSIVVAVFANNAYNELGITEDNRLQIAFRIFEAYRNEQITKLIQSYKNHNIKEMRK